MTAEQGDIISIEGKKGYYLVVSKNFFNQTEQAVLCPIVQDTFLDPLHIRVNTDVISGIVMCEQLRLADLRYRGFKKIDRISYSDIMNLTDAIQGIFDY